MSREPPATGRVQSIKSKFESLKSLESLDITGPTVKTVPKSYFQLHQRSATSLDLTALRKVPNGKVPLAGRNVSIAKGKKSVEIQRQASDSFLLKNHNTVVRDKLKPLKEIKENVEVRLSRHTSDPVKRGSIKRSPAFRVGGNSGDRSSKTILTKSPSIPKEFAEKFDELLKRCAPEEQITPPTAFQETGLTDTLKAALKQPLPTGPPPKKPPRTFESPSPKEDVDPVALFASKQSEAPAIPETSPPVELQTKINYLEHNLVLSSSGGGGKTRPHIAKDKGHMLANSFLSCIPCSSAPLYDTVIVKQNGAKVSAKPFNGHPLTNGKSPDKKDTEPIYMEPFSHLKMKTNAQPIVPEPVACGHSHSNGNDIMLNSNQGSACDSDASSHNVSSTSCSSCVDNPHKENGGDIHYMVSRQIKVNVQLDLSFYRLNCD